MRRCATLIGVGDGHNMSARLIKSFIVKVVHCGTVDGAVIRAAWPARLPVSRLLKKSDDGGRDEIL